MKEALTLALEALEAIYTVGDVACVVKPEGEIYLKPVINKCKAALASTSTQREKQPAQRPWVGLTNDEVNNFAAGCHLGKSVQGAIYKAEAKLKEKNT